MFISLIKRATTKFHLGVNVKKCDKFSEWYTQVIKKAGLIEYYDVSGCYVVRPWSFAIWEAIQAFVDAEIKKLGVKNCYFPMFVTEGALRNEESHLAGFASEVAWVTRAGGSKLAKPIAIRPTSETVMYPSFARWCQSHRDLPIKLNQWCNVVRWEFKHPMPLLRSREFLWQEGHTAYATEEEAVAEVFTICDLYARVYTDLLAIPVIKGRKSEKEKFAGGDFTTTVEAYVPANGRAIQGATSHHLGQNFSKMFSICFEHPDRPGQKEFAWQNSWGISTRTIGAMVMVHGDDKGLVLPPRVAAIQVVVIPVGITAKTSEGERQKLMGEAEEIVRQLSGQGIRVEGDFRENHSPGFKFNHWELKGVPIRLELGPKDLAEEQAVAVLRYNGEKRPLKLKELGTQMGALLEQIHQGMYKKVEKLRDEHLQLCLDWAEFTPLLDQKMLLLSPFCGRPACETLIRKQSVREGVADQPGTSQMGAKTLCIPLEQPREVTLPEKCIHPACTEKAKFFALFGRSY